MPTLSKPLALPRRFLRCCRPMTCMLFMVIIFLVMNLYSPDEEYDARDDPYAEAEAILNAGSTTQPAAGNKRGHSWLDSFKAPEEEPTPSGLRYADDGLVRGWDEIHEIVETRQLKRDTKKRLTTVMNTHPIEALIEKGKRRWADLLANQSKTLPQAVTEYTRRYGRAPPRGFEEWWQFCKRNNVKIVDDYDQIDRDISPYFALSPAKFRNRTAELLTTAVTYQITLDPSGETTLTGERKNSARGKLLHTLVRPLAPLFPTKVTFTMSDHDLGSWLLAEDQRQAAKKAIEKGRYLTDPQLKRLESRNAARVEVPGIVSACPEGSPAWNRKLGRNWTSEAIGEQKETTFLHDPRATYDFCFNPTLLDMHGALSFDFTRETILRPIFQLSKAARNPEFLTTPLEAYENATSADALKKYTPWEEKTDNRLFWRGSSTGDSYSRRKNYDWRRSHRPRFSLMTQQEEGEKAIWVERGREWQLEKWSMKKLNERYMDAGLSGAPHQCKKEDGTCDEMAAEIKFKERVKPEDSAKYKYQFDIDGNGWSSRYHRLMVSGSVVVKATIYPEWHSDWQTPWVHYVPCQIDYSDLYDIMSFFTGSPDGRSGGHDHLAREISEQARQFGLEHWRWEDMQAYMFRLLLEYLRLQADDREGWSYQKTYD